MGSDYNSGRVSGTVTAVLQGSVSTGIPTPTVNQSIKTIDSSVSQGIGTTTSTLYTVTAGKTFYVTRMAIKQSASISSMEIRDGASTTKLLGSGPLWSTADQNFDITFPTPMTFTTDVRTNHGVLGIAVSCAYTIIGWEE